MNISKEIQLLMPQYEEIRDKYFKILYEISEKETDINYLVNILLEKNGIQSYEEAYDFWAMQIPENEYPEKVIPEYTLKYFLFEKKKKRRHSHKLLIKMCAAYHCDFELLVKIFAAYDYYYDKRKKKYKEKLLELYIVGNKLNN